MPSRAPLASDIEGTVELRRYGFTQRAQLKFHAPDSLWVHIVGDVSHLASDEIYVAQGETQKTFSTDLGRVRQWRWSSAREPWRSQALADGGPANIWLWGWKTERIAPFYSVATMKNGDVTTIVLTARAEKSRQIRDALRSGGRGDRLFYAPFKQTVFDWPRRVLLKLDRNQSPTFVEKRDARLRVLESTAFTWKDGWPLSATTRDGNNHIMAQWKYNLKAAPAPFSSDVFELDKATQGASSRQIVEDVEPLPLAEYARKTDADALFNRGVVEAAHTEDFSAAFGDWGKAATSKSSSIAPLATAFDTALALRDWQRAQMVLPSLAALLKSDDVTLLHRRLRLATLKRDWASVLADLSQLGKARPADLGFRLQNAVVRLSGGDTKGAQSVLLEILAFPSQQIDGQSDAFGDWTQANAAQNLAQILSVPSAKNDAFALLQTLPKTTPAQRLARALIALQLGQTPESTGFDNDAFASAWANAQSAQGKTDDAVATWKTIAARASLATSTNARRNLMSLYAARGEVGNSLIEYSKVVLGDNDQSARDDSRRLLFDAWRKAGKSDRLRSAIQTRATAPATTDEDARLWLAWQEGNASAKSIGESVRVFATRFPKSAWWQSRLGEQLVADAAPLDKDDTDKARFTTQALTEVRRAVALDKTQPYYAVQAALILTLRANDFRKSAVNDSFSPGEANDLANAELDALRQTRGDDADISLAIAFAGQALSAKYPGVIELLKNGINGGFARRESYDGDRHATVFAARQALAIALRRQGDLTGAAQQWQNLILSARDASEEVGIAINFLTTLKDMDAVANKAVAASGATSSTRSQVEKTTNAPNASGTTPVGTPSLLAARGAAQMLSRLASESWALENAESATRAFATYLQADLVLWPQVVAVLRASDQPTMQLGAAHFFFTLENSFSAMASRANKPEMQSYLDDLLQKARLWSSEAEAKLTTLANGGDKIVAARAAFLLGERALTRHDFDGAIAQFQMAVVLEPDSLETRFALARTLVAAGRNAEALQARDTIAQNFAPTTLLFNRLAALSNKLGQADDALQQSQLAWNLACAPDADSNDAQRAGFLLARSLVAKNRLAEARVIYINLSGAGWDFTGRIAAFSAQENAWRKAGNSENADQAKTQRAALKPGAADLQAAKTFLESLDS